MRVRLSLAILFFSLSLSAQETAAPADKLATMTFHFSWPDAKPERYTIQAQQNDIALYWIGPPDFDLTEAAGVRKLQISHETTDTIFSASTAVMTEHCETKQKNIAQTGIKTLVYGFDHGSKACTFNYSDDEKVQEATNILMALAETIQLGTELARLRRFDRLGLDAEMTALETELGCGRAIEVENISSTLQAIANDDRVMERVRRKAAHLLEAATTSVAKP